MNIPQHLLSMPCQRLYHLSHSPINYYFNPSPRDFVVREIPLYEASGSGEHLILYVRKKGISTFELLDILSSVLGCKVRDIGYAGLKDKMATTYQYISIHHSLQARLSQALPYLESRQIKILSLIPHHNKLKIGHLRGNMFFVRLKKVNPQNAHKINCILAQIAHSGFPNYFGDQRFGKEGDNFVQGRMLGYKQEDKKLQEQHLFFSTSKKTKNKKLSNFLISSYQSHLFNLWLKTRIQFSQILRNFTPNEVLEALHTPILPLLNPFAKYCNKALLQDLQKQPTFFVLLPGDVMCHYPHGKMYVCDNQNMESQRFFQHEVSPMGALCGSKLFSAHDIALKFEDGFLDHELYAIGSRRYAWVWASEISSHYKEQEAHYELCFSLPKGSYATVFLESLLYVSD